MEHYILCASIFMCIALDFCAPGGLSAGTHQFSFSFARLRSIREPGICYPPVSVSAEFMSCLPGANQGAGAYYP